MIAVRAWDWMQPTGTTKPVVVGEHLANSRAAFDTR